LVALAVRAPLVAGALVLAALAPSAAQELAEPILRGRVLLGDSTLSTGTVVLHRVTDNEQGEIAYADLADDGTFSFLLPTVPDPARSDVFLASVDYLGLLYFGQPITLPIQLDSIYEIRTYDTTVVASGGTTVPIQVRNLFLELSGTGWFVTDVFLLHNDGARTLVARDGGAVWRHPVPPSASGLVIADMQFAEGGVSVDGGDVAILAGIPPGERYVVVRYLVPDPYLEIPIASPTEALEVYVREPAPPIEAPALTLGEPVELEAGVTYRRYVGVDVSGPIVRLLEGEDAGPPPVRELSVILSLTLAALGMWAVRNGGSRGPMLSPADVRSRIVLEVARLDDAFASRRAVTQEERGAYEARRRGLVRRLNSAG
jgi:hypothetical protein